LNRGREKPRRGCPDRKSGLPDLRTRMKKPIPGKPESIKKPISGRPEIGAQRQ
jgi:hypothetical protein